MVEDSRVEDSTGSLAESLIWKALSQIPDPEIPVISLVDLGIIREIQIDNRRVTVKITPTYSGCPALDAMREEIISALKLLGYESIAVQTVISPAWTTDWLSEETKEKLRRYGISPPEYGAEKLVQLNTTASCPRCGQQTEKKISEFGSTACKSLWHCKFCQEPFEYFKPI